MLHPQKPLKLSLFFYLNEKKFTITEILWRWSFLVDSSKITSRNNPSSSIKKAAGLICAKNKISVSSDKDDRDFNSFCTYELKRKKK
jgi:hypothetical protein